MKYVFVFFILFAASQAQAKVVHVCPSGNDKNFGTIKSPIATWSAAIDALNSSRGGDFILLCRGGEWEIKESRRVRNNHCSQERPCSWGAYGEGKDPVAKLAKGVDVTPFNIHDPTDGIAIRDIKLVGNGLETRSQGMFFYNDVDGVTIENVEIEGFITGIQNAHGPMGFVSGFTLKNVNIHDNHGQGFLGGGDDLYWENVHLENNGTSWGHHNAYISCGNQTTQSKNLRFKNVTSLNSGGGVGFVMHGMCEDIEIDGLRAIEEGVPAHINWGFSADNGGYPSAEYFNNLVVKNSYFENTGNMFLGCSDCNGFRFENNELHFKNHPINGTAIMVPNKESDGFMPLLRGTIINNIIRITNAPEHEITGIRVDGVPNAVVKNNKVFFDDGNVVCWKVNDAAVMENNYCGSEADFPG